jgi:hypothetical protein
MNVSRELQRQPDGQKESSKAALPCDVAGGCYPINECVDSGEAGSSASLDKLSYTSKIFLVMLTCI